MKPETAAQIAKYLAGALDPHERAVFQAEMAADSALRAEVDAMQRIWDCPATEADDQWDHEAAWQKVSAARQPATAVRRTRILPWVVSAAAAIVLFVGVRFLMEARSTNMHIAGADAPLTVGLADGSAVTLRNGSQLTEFKFTKGKRRVKLEGEAYFEVTPDPSRPFVIECGASITEVVGTSFTIRETGSEVTILVTSGKVIFRTAVDSGEATALQAGESATCTDGTITLVPNPSVNFDAWRSRELRFIGIPLEEAVRDISSFFGTRITIDSEAVKQCRITIPLPFREPDLRSVLRAVAMSVRAELVETDGQFVIQGGTCIKSK
jgi:ferric-dicitrate binding protein FerR (iron transport regulator)